jgi:hypothetical protein
MLSRVATDGFAVPPQAAATTPKRDAMCAIDAPAPALPPRRARGPQRTAPLRRHFWPANHAPRSNRCSRHLLCPSGRPRRTLVQFIAHPPALRTLEDQLAATNDCRRRFAPYCLSSLRPGQFCWRPFQGCRQHRGPRSRFPQPHHRPHLQHRRRHHHRHHHRHHRPAPMTSSPCPGSKPLPTRQFRSFSHATPF